MLVTLLIFGTLLNSKIDFNMKELAKLAPLWYMLALGLPVVIFMLIAPNAQEKSPFLAYLICLVTFFGAVFLSSGGDLKLPGKNALKWYAISAIIALAEATLLVFAA